VNLTTPNAVAKYGVAQKRRTVVCVQCGQTRPHSAKGLCNRCYLHDLPPEVQAKRRDSHRAWLQKRREDPEYLKREAERQKAWGQTPEGAEYQKQYAKNYRPPPKTVRKARDRHLQKTYGISLVEFERRSEDQLGLCAICLRAKKRLVVDHCHQTGKIRGLLCVSCNRGLGYLCDQPAVIRSAALYLEKFA